jgi:AraC family transcriptional regulator, arabinose operon regulatory protein
MNNTRDIRIREGFPKQRLVVIPSSVIKRCRNLPIVRLIYVTDIGMYPAAPHHFVERENGCLQAILICCLEGSGYLEMDNTSHKVQPGHVIVIPPGIPHVYRADKTDPWSICWIHFTGEETLAVMASLGANRTSPLLYVPDIRLLQEAFEEVYATLNYHYSDAGLLAMTSELLRMIAAITLHYGHIRRPRQSVEDRVMATQSFMQRHVDMKLTLKDLAVQSGQSAPYYSKLFKARSSQSPMAYFIQLKIRKACELLDRTELPVRDIAARVGYDDPYYFSRIFKKVQGRSPARYRISVKG